MIRSMVEHQDQRIHPAGAPRRIGVCGASMLKDPAAESFCRALGHELARNRTPILVSGGCHYRKERKPPGGDLPKRLAADWYTIDSAEKELAGEGGSAAVGSRIETMLPDPANESQDVDKHVAKFRKGRVVMYPHSTPQSRRFRFVSSVDVLVAIGGNTGTLQNLQLAFALGIPTLLVPQFTEKKTWPLCEEEGERMQQWFGIPATEWQEWMAVRNDAKDGMARMSREDIEQLAARCATLLIARLKLPCFVIMPFKGHDELFENAIKPAVEAAGYLPVRTDKLNVPGEILATIGRGIENCSCAIAVITDLRANVMYELGLAHAHRKPVLILMKSSHDEVESKAPFDVKTHTILGYTTVDEDLRERIRSMLVETRWTLVGPPHLAFDPAKLEEIGG